MIIPCFLGKLFEFIIIHSRVLLLSVFIDISLAVLNY